MLKKSYTGEERRLIEHQPSTSNSKNTSVELLLTIIHRSGNWTQRSTDSKRLNSRHWPGLLQT